MTDERLLQETRGYIQQGWTQGAEGRDADGRNVPGVHQAAVCWCLTGAFARVIADGDLGHGDGVVESARTYLIRALRRRSAHGKLYDWNDDPGRTQAEVLALVDEAITEARA